MSVPFGVILNKIMELSLFSTAGSYVQLDPFEP